ncbi:hypothetical protein I3842_06G017300 [Carya illinoinensis]|uniref:Protein kinase domain-containing protein n=1 Tax=Carya illinoinensis TaxID=32201 RepID=A0A922EPH8_CARIL|nr:hypothetical protein I3842_06G017300 [Carya illinoinensis]
MKRINLLPTLRSPIALLINLCIIFYSLLPRKSLGVDNPYFQACSVHKTCGDKQNINFYPGCDGGNKNVSVLALHEQDSKVVAPVEAHRGNIRVTQKWVLSEMEVKVSDDGCSQCDEKEGQCQIDRNICPEKGVGCPAIVIIIICLWRSYKKKNASTSFLARSTYAVQSSRSDLEGGSVYFGVHIFPYSELQEGVYFGVHIFPYSELQEATNNFDDEKELGDGGFGTVYYGKLHDGREVAVKRLYEHNCRQVQQFINEVEILMRMRHKNLVSLYGCTSHRSRELLLVSIEIRWMLSFLLILPNGTVADHIHGDRGSLPWPTRMGIAIETASALAYLHASEIIHRDVKTNNSLLDNNFCVKVADFGLSRLFPNDVTHVSTRPQGTPGYVDPEYRQCYQLTKKSDVYSFGVVLIELISSLPAVDITRHRHEINLANLALIDPHLGFQLDDEVKRMTILVASLAFQCIQGGQELRPSHGRGFGGIKGTHVHPSWPVMASDKPTSSSPPPSPSTITNLATNLFTVKLNIDNFLLLKA